MAELSTQASGLSIAVVCRNEERNIGDALMSIVHPSRPSLEFEILVIDNGSTDGTEEAVHRFAEQHPDLSVSWIPMDRNHLGFARKTAIEKARYAFVAFTDADCRVPSDWAEKMLRAFFECRESALNVVAVGSGNSAPETGAPFYRSMTTMLSSYFGHFGTTQAFRRSDRCAVAHLPTCNVLYDRQAVLSSGNFSEDFDRVCEDVDLSHRLRRDGGSLIYIPGLDVEHRHAISYFSWAEKMYRYGWGQIQVAKRHPAHLNGIKALPLICALSTIILFAAVPGLGFVLISAYMMAIIIYSFYLSVRSENISDTFRIALFFLITHSFYSLGELSGLISVFCGAGGPRKHGRPMCRQKNQVECADLVPAAAKNTK